MSDSAGVVVERMRKPGGRPRLEDGQRCRQVNARLRPAVLAMLCELGGGSESRGLRLLADWFEKNRPNIKPV